MSQTDGAVSAVETYRLHDFLTIETNVDLQIPDFHHTTDESDLPSNVLRVIETADGSTLKPDSGAVEFDDGTLRMCPDGVEQEAAISISGLDSNQTVIRWTPTFRRKYDYMSVYEGALSIRLLDRNVAVVHAAGIEYEGRCLVLPSMGRMGKTTTILNVLNKVPEAGFLSDNLLLVDRSGDAYAYPATPVVFPGTAFDDRDLSLTERLSLLGRQTVARSDLLSALLLHRYDVDLSQSVFANEYAGRTVPSAPIDEVVVLNGARSNSQNRDHSTESVVAKIATGTDMELDPDDRFLEAYATRSSAERIHPVSVRERRRDVLLSALETVPCSELFRNDITEYTSELTTRLTG